MFLVQNIKSYHLGSMLKVKYILLILLMVFFTPSMAIPPFGRVICFAKIGQGRWCSSTLIPAHLYLGRQHFYYGLKPSTLVYLFSIPWHIDLYFGSFSLCISLIYQFSSLTPVVSYHQLRSHWPSPLGTSSPKYPPCSYHLHPLICTCRLTVFRGKYALPFRSIVP